MTESFIIAKPNYFVTDPKGVKFCLPGESTQGNDPWAYLSPYFISYFIIILTPGQNLKYATKKMQEQIYVYKIDILFHFVDVPGLIMNMHRTCR